MNIKNVIFDLGKVLVDFDFDIFFHKIGQNPNERHLDEAIEPILLFESGKIKKSDFIQRMRNVYKFDISDGQFEKVWCENIFTEIPEMIELAEKIMKNYNIFILSNTDEIHFPHIWEKFSSLHFFEKNLLLSYELDAVKPEPVIYLNALKRFNLTPRECIFIDDRPVNIEVAEKVGLYGIVNENYHKTKQHLEKILDFI